MSFKRSQASFITLQSTEFLEMLWPQRNDRQRNPAARNSGSLPSQSTMDVSAFAVGL